MSGDPAESNAEEAAETDEPGGAGEVNSDEPGDAGEVNSDEPGGAGEVSTDEPADADEVNDVTATADAGETGGATAGNSDDEELAALRRQVEEKYDFDDFGPADMAEMSLEEWEVAFDEDTWITGPALLDRVEAELKNRIAAREVFARLEQVREADGSARLLAYSDEGYAIVYPDGSVEGRGTVVRDVKPSVALCSMEEYPVEEPPADFSLPKPGEVPDGAGELGNRMMQAVAGSLLLSGLGLSIAWLVTDLSTVFAPIIGMIFVAAGVFLFATVANARLSERFRAEEYRDRLRALNFENDERPEFLPLDEDGRLVPRTGENGGDGGAET